MTRSRVFLVCAWALFTRISGAADHSRALRLELTADHMVLAGKPVEVELDLTPLLEGAPLDPAKLKAVQSGSSKAMAAQFDAIGPSRGVLTMILASPLRPSVPQIVEITYGRDPASPAPLVRVTDNVEHQGQISLKIETQAGTYIYHKEGAGLASLIDPDGRDWISYRPGNGSAGEFRGIPNLGLYAHPGYTGEKGGTTLIESKGPVRARVRSTSRSGDYVLVWDFFPMHARLTIEKAGQPYWFLYEGTPGGSLDLDSDFVVTSSGERRPVSQSWHGDLPGPEWVYFGDAKQNRSLFVLNYQDDNKGDQFWQMQGNMTVFGFGREYRCCGRFLTAAPARFTVGLAETLNFEIMKATIDSMTQPVKVRSLRTSDSPRH